MWTEAAFALTLQLPPLAFNTTPPTPIYSPPRELTCPVPELGKPWAPPPPRPIWTRLREVEPRGLRPREPDHLLNPVADIFVFFALAGLASHTGGTVDLRPWFDRTAEGMVQPPLFPPSSAQPPAKPRF